MEISTAILCALVALAAALAGAGAAWALLRGMAAAAERRGAENLAAQEKSFRERLEEKDSSLRDREQECARLGSNLAESREELARAEERTQSLERQKAELREMVGQFEKQMRDSFGALSADALRKAGDDFLKLASERLSKEQVEAKGELETRKQAIESLLKPVHENLQKLEQQCTELEKKREVAYSRIEQQVSGLMMAAGQLQSALRKPTVRGSWGEMTLRTVVENAGMQEGVHYVLQHTTDTEDGKLRADMVVNLPKARRIALDSKAPLDSFREAVACEEEAARDGHFKQHARQVRAHMKALSEKQYWSQYEGLDIVIMFLPSEAMFYTAVEHDSTLLEDARKARVYLANPSTLMATLNAIAYVLDQERLNDGAKDISRIGQKLYDGVRTFASHMDRLGVSLRKSVEAYNQSVRSLERSVLPRARQLREKGVNGQEMVELEPAEALPIGFQQQELLSALGAPEPLALVEAGDSVEAVVNAGQ